MSVHSDSPWQRPTYPPRDTAHTYVASDQEYTGYPFAATHAKGDSFSGHSYDPSFVASKPPHETIDGAALRGRTPSPTPSEQKELGSGAIDWKAMMKWRFWIRKEWIWYYIIIVIILVLTALMTLYHTQIVDWLTPVTKWLHDLSFGWIVPIAVLFVISFPPLFGHEIVAILCGLVWGLWIGFAIVAAGTFLGEHERTSIWYACLAKVVRDGGFKIALIARLSAIPGHFTTAIFATCGMGIIVFSIAAILSMPKQFITVYLGVILEQSATGTSSTKSRIISDVVLAVTVLITILAMWYILYCMNKAKPAVIYAKRKARQAKLERQVDLSGVNGHFPESSYTTLGATDYSYVNNSDSEIPLTALAAPMGYTPPFPKPKHFQDSTPDYSHEPHLHAPKPQRAERQMPRLESENDALESAVPLRTAFDGAQGRNDSQRASPYQSHQTPSAPMNPIQPPLDPFRDTSPVHHPSDTPYERETSRQLTPSYSPRNHSGPLQSSPVSLIDPSVVAAPPIYRAYEATHDSFHAVNTNSPEPMIETDSRSRAPRPLAGQQDPSRWDSLR
ncbi:hypothetical protein P691DRAFT_382491 [Macrolepiota fuliginosa MF-IS2]|uniref:Golgi apparatus membrane protein TVP38 n=1 Tax=Macrolepiota fuliginosa MF-IS2 TaxID=1400762 RepID=A0A9P5X4D0_9AGAR|nr:hypothetical protein P691DRAFT_382491 [Macrolepiota fuliginosa MF-IS2]